MISASNLVYPPTVTADADRYRYLYAALEQLRLKHNERAGDLTPQTLYWRREWRKPHDGIIQNILPLRARLRTPDWRVSDSEPVDPALALLRGEGKADYRSADYKVLTGFDLDAVSGAMKIEDPTADFTAFSNTSDPGSDIIATASKLDLNDVRGDSDTYWWDDRGVDHFGAAFEHLFEATQYDSGSDYYISLVIWGVSNVAANEEYLDDNSSQALCVYLRTRNPTTSSEVFIKDYEDDSSDSYSAVSADIKHYYTAARTSETAVQCIIYSDAGRTLDEDTIATTITSGRRYRYGAGCAIENDGDSRGFTADIENLDWQEGGEPPATNPRRRLLIGA